MMLIANISFWGKITSDIQKYLNCHMPDYSAVMRITWGTC